MGEWWCRCYRALVLDIFTRSDAEHGFEVLLRRWVVE